MATYSVTITTTDLQERAIEARKARAGQATIPNVDYVAAAAQAIAGPALDRWAQEHIDWLITRSRGGEVLTAQEQADVKGWLGL